MTQAVSPGFSDDNAAPGSPAPVTKPAGRQSLRFTNVYVQGLVTAAVLGLLTNFGSQGPGSGLPAGYSAGTGDHYVLSQVGLHWADPTRYAGDWFMESAPQPHWFFDTLTFVGSSLGVLPLAYLLFWFAGLAAFGFAAAFLSRVWAPQSPWAFGLTATVVAALTPWAIVGTGSSMISLAIPAVVSANLVFLFIAAAISGRGKWMLAAAILTAIVHVQQGAVVAVLLAAMAVVQFARERRVSKSTAVTFVVTVGIVAGGLIARPVAANTDDFIQICNEVIPYHCAAQLWSMPTIVGAVTVILLALATFFYQPSRDRDVWWAVVFLPMIGLFLGLSANALSVPLFGELAQGLNVYRLGALVLPFAVMGMLLPVFRLGRRHLVVTVLVLVLSSIYLLSSGWQLPRPLSVLFIAALVVIGLGATIVRARSLLPNQMVSRVGAVALVVLFLGSAIGAGKITVRPLDATYIPNPVIREWGEAVEAVVPAGESLLAPPLATYVRAATYRGVIVDCKNVPYGGEPWAQWQERLSDLGGETQCRSGGPGLYNSLTAEAVDQAADKYGVRYAVIEAGQAHWIPELREIGWTEVLGPTPGLDNVVLHKSGT